MNDTSMVESATERPSWATPAPSGPGRAPGAFEAEARLTVRPDGLLFRALREEEVERAEDGTVRLMGGTLRPRARGSGVSAVEAVGSGSRAQTTPFVHFTTDITVAAYLAAPMPDGKRRGSGLVAVLDR